MTPEPAASLLATSLAWAQAAAVAAYAAAQVLIVLYAAHRWLLLWRWWPARSGARPAPAAPDEAGLPVVTVQLPVFNERRVITRLINAAAALDYPPGKLEIQVLDDSTDETRTLAAAAVARHRARGIDIHHRVRPRRDGYKAGALAGGLEAARGDLVAVFDADFVPPSGFLRRLVPHFNTPSVGMVQARWSHLNRGRSALTTAQATMLDAHFLIEHPARMRAGLFFNFNGSAGLWRRACIEDAGGWSDDTVTEDLDLSYRAQLKGWRFVFDASVAAPGELPADVAALRCQQRRWTRGALQTARKLLPAILGAPLPVRVKLEAFVHLTGNLAYPLLLAFGLLLLPVLLAPATLAPAVVWAIQAAVLLLGVMPTVLFMVAGRRQAGGGGLAIARDVLRALLLGVGLSLHNARAALAGLRGGPGRWDRTPKTGDVAGHPAPTRHYVAAGGGAGWSELLLAVGFAGVGMIAWRAGHTGAAPFAALLAVGLGGFGLATLRAVRSHA